MTTSERVAVFLSRQPDVTSGLGYSERRSLDEGDHGKIVSDHIHKLRKQTRWGRISAAFTGGILLLAGLWSLAHEFGIIEPSFGDASSSRGMGILLVTGAAAIATLFRVGELQKRVTLFESAKEIDSFLESSD